MHIIHLVTRLLRAGSEENTLMTCAGQVRAGHRVTVIHGCDFDPTWYLSAPAGVAFVECPEMVHPVRPMQDRRAVQALRKLYRELDPDVIHTHQSKAGILGRLASSAVPDALVVHGIHIVPFEGVSAQKRALFVAAEKIAAKRTDLFIGVSHAMGAAYVDAGIARADQVHCVRSGMDLQRFRNPTVPDDWRNILQLKSDEPKPRVALMMASFEARKKHLPFIYAFAKVADDIPDLKLLFAGSGPEEENAKAAVTELGLAERICFAGQRSDPEALFAMADVSFLASEKEGLPRVAVQSLASGVPVILRDLPGMSELVDDGVNSHLCADIGSMVETLAAMTRSPLAMRTLKRGAQATDVSDWSHELMSTQTTSLYRGHMPQTHAAKVAAQ